MKHLASRFFWALAAVCFGALVVCWFGGVYNLLFMGGVGNGAWAYLAMCSVFYGACCAVLALLSSLIEGWVQRCLTK